MSSPFDKYPAQWRQLRGKLDCESETCRRVYGLKLQKITRETECVYCHQSLVDTYAHWLLMSVDHVVPKDVGKSAGISEKFLLDYINCVLCCSGCNGFKVTLPEVRHVETEAEFTLQLHNGGGVFARFGGEALGFEEIRIRPWMLPECTSGEVLKPPDSTS